MSWISQGPRKIVTGIILARAPPRPLNVWPMLSMEKHVRVDQHFGSCLRISWKLLLPYHQDSLGLGVSDN